MKEEWRTFEEQRKNFDMERRSFTEAAIRLGHEVSHQGEYSERDTLLYNIIVCLQITRTCRCLIMKEIYPLKGTFRLT